MSYRVVEFDARAVWPKIFTVGCMSILFTFLNPLTSNHSWVKAGENFVLFFPVIVGILLYGFATGAVFAAGQAAWSRVIGVVRRGKNHEIDAILAEKPDQFPTLLMFIGWFILVLSSFMIQVPREMLFLLFFLHMTLLLPLALAMDYWGFTDGIKRVERR